MSKLYNGSSVGRFIEQAMEKGFEVTQLNEGVLLGGDYLIEKDGYLSTVIWEKALNEWSSAYQARRFDTRKPQSAKALDNLTKKLKG